MLPSGSAFKQPSAQRVLEQKLSVIRKQVDKGRYAEAPKKLQNDILSKMNGCIDSKAKAPAKNDWVRSCDVQKQLYWAVNEIVVLLKIVA